MEADFNMAREIQQVFLPRQYPVFRAEPRPAKAPCDLRIGIFRRRLWGRFLQHFPN